MQVDQGTQHRFFTYDGLSRLKTAKNPEQVSGSTQIATTYAYDDASNLISKSGPNSGTSLSFTYDGLNRVKTKTLTKPSVSTVWDYTYDTATISNAKGRLVSVVLHGVTDGCYYDGYDGMGRVTASRQVTTSGSANTYTMSYGYNLAGEMTKQVYPSGKEYRTSFDDAGRVSQVSRYNSSVFDKTYASGFGYTAHGAVSSMTLGNNRIEETTFNGRLQPTQIAFGTLAIPSSLLQLDYTYNTTGLANNNGNVLTQTITAPKTQGGSLVLTQNYSYDVLNRMSIAEEFISGASQWKQTYDIDRWGNRAVRSNSYILPQNVNLTPQSANSTDFSAFNQNTNRIALGGFDYDISGNLKADPTTVANAMVYDAENRQTSYTRSGATTSYSYDGDGHRVKRTDPDNTTMIFVYNAGGQLIAEYTSGTPSGGGTSYLTSDHLGSTRVVTDSSGGVKARYDYLPFGEEIGLDRGSRSLVSGYGSSDKTRQKFTQKERDTESGLDYFLARYYSSAQGRFTSADPLYLELRRLRDPQQLNLYAYTRGNPLKFTDPLGLDITVTGTERDEYIKQLQKLLSFKIKLDANTGKVGVDGPSDKKALKELEKKLKGGEKDLFKAINDTKNHVTIDTVSRDANVDFGRFDGGGKNTLDFSDIGLLGAAKNAGGLSSEQVVGHETLEAYASSKGNNFADSHNFANQFFGGLENPDPATLRVYGVPGAGTILRSSAEFPVHGKPNVREQIMREFLTPIPMNAIPQGHTPAHIVNVEKKP